MSIRSTEWSKTAEPSDFTSRIRQTLIELLEVSAVLVVSTMLVRTWLRCSTSQRSTSPTWNL
jgi:hypothetical protein